MAEFSAATVDLHELAEECDRIVLVNGFDPHIWEYAALKVAWVFTEIDEAIDASIGVGEDPLEEELADIAIRLLSLLHGLTEGKWHDRITNRKPYVKRTPYQPIESLLYPIGSHCAKALESWRNENRSDFVSHLELSLKETFDLASILNFDLISSILAKNEKNKSRGERHDKANERA